MDSYPPLYDHPSAGPKNNNGVRSRCLFWRFLGQSETYIPSALPVLNSPVFVGSSGVSE